MQINPLKQIMALYKNEADSPRPKDSAAAQVNKFAEESTFFVNFFRVRAEDIAPFLWNRFYKDLQKKHKRKLRRVNKKNDCAKSVLHKRQHKTDDQDNLNHDYI